LAQAYANRGVIRLQQGKVEQAEQDIKQAIALDAALKPSLEKYLAEMKRYRAKKP
ncbi:MAG: hypothetical protein QOE47_2524, partial [Pyrinomonadaceae bacterium]|nr:hypothetical protein [Pyrinomonadaceae bacterium]